MKTKNRIEGLKGNHPFVENHYIPHLKDGSYCKKWSGSLPVNYGNEKSNPRGKQTNIYSTDTTQGCSNQCVGCFGARMCKQTLKNFGWIKNVRLKGVPKGNAFLWSTCQKPIPDGILKSNIGFNVTIDTMRELSFQNRSLRAIKALGPNRTIIVFKVYPGNKESKKRNLALYNFLHKRGYKKFIQVIVRLFSHKQAKKTGSVICPKNFDEKLNWYKEHKVKQLGLVCGSLGSGKCIDCMICYNVHNAKYRIGTSADPMDRPKHTEGELKRLKWI